MPLSGDRKPDRLSHPPEGVYSTILIDPVGARTLSYPPKRTQRVGAPGSMELPGFPLPEPEQPLISRLRGTLLTKDISSVEIETSGGVVYEVEVPLTVHERLPSGGKLGGAQDRAGRPGGLGGPLRLPRAPRAGSFQENPHGQGSGSQQDLDHVIHFLGPSPGKALAEKDITALSQISGVGRKTAERLALELSEKVRDLALIPEGAEGVPPEVEGAVSALVALGYSFSAADAAIRKAFRRREDPTTDELVRKALSGQ